jgi:predicted site-specific integrase-resolvase
MLITLKEWAERRGVKLNTARRRVLAGSLPGAVKRGRDWWIEENQEYTDRRFKNTTPAK